VCATIASAWLRLTVLHQFVRAQTDVFLTDILICLSLSEIRVHRLLYEVHDEESAEEIRELINFLILKRAISATRHY